MITRNVNDIKPSVSFYSLKAVLNDGRDFYFSSLKDKKVLIVNTASDCGYTGQYEELEAIYKKYKNRLEILAFPSNDFGQQEKADDEVIALFCKMNYGVDFPLMKKTVIVRSEEQNEVYEWLTNAAKNGWNNKVPEWNFSKFLVNKEGVLTHSFVSSISPQSDELLRALNE